MKKLVTCALAFAALAFACFPACGETADPPPILSASELPDNGRQFVGVQRVTVCENGVCRVVEVETPDAPLATATAPAACQSTAASSRREWPLFERVRTWYPGKLFQAVRANRAAARSWN